MFLALCALVTPTVAHALEFEPIAADLPVNIQSTDGIAITIAKSEITVTGIQSSLLNIQCQVYIQYPDPGALVILLSSPDGSTICLADSEGSITSTGNNPIQGQNGQNGNNGGVVIGNSGAGSNSGGFGVSNVDAPKGMVEFSNLTNIVNSIDQFQNANVATIPSGIYLPSEPPSILFEQFVVPELVLIPPYFLANGYPGATAGYNLNQFRGLADLNLNGKWTLQVWNFDPNINTGTIQWWALEVNQVGNHVWTGGGLDNRFSDQSNWVQPAGAPNAWEQKALLVFPNSAGQFTANNDVPGLTIGQLTIDGNYAVTGDAVTLTGNAVIDNQGGISNWALNMGLTYPATGLKALNSSAQATGPTIFTSAGELVLSGVLSGGDGAPNAIPANTNITVYGPATTVFTGNNSYPGETDVLSGILQITNGNCLVGSQTVVSAGASLQLGGTLIPATPLTVAPASPTPWPYPGGSNTLAEPLVLAGFGVAGNGALENIVPGQNINVTGTVDLAVTDVGIGAVPTAAFTFATAAQLTGGNLDFQGEAPAPGGGTLNMFTQPNSGLSANGGTININIPAPGISRVSTLGVSNEAAIDILGANLTVGLSISSSPLGLTASPNVITGNLIFQAGGLPITVLAGPDVTPDLILTGGSITASAMVLLGNGRLVDNDTAGGTTPPAVGISSGTFGGIGVVGNVNVDAGAVLEPGFNSGGTLTVNNLLMSSASVYTADLTAGANLTVGGTISLSGTQNGASGALLRPVGGGAGTYTIINYPANNLTTAFFARPFPTSSGINYTVGNDSVQLTLDGSSIALQASAYSFSKGAGTVTIPVTWITGSNPPASSLLIGQAGTAVQQQDYLQPTPVPLTQAAGSAYSLTIVQNYIAEGNTNFKLLLVPLGETTAAPNASEANVTIIDNQSNDYNAKHCGFGSGLTVFFLGSLILFLRLRSRRR